MDNGNAQARKFTISDGMILIGVLSPGLALTARAWYRFAPMATNDHIWGRVWMAAIVGSMIVLPLLFALTVGSVVARARRPRPSWRRVMRQPGATACLVVLVWFLLAAAVLCALIAIIYFKPDDGTRRDSLGEMAAGCLSLLTFCTTPIAATVVVSWIVLAIQRGWRCEKSWTDRFGRLVGCLWIAMGTTIGIELLRSTLFD